MLFVCVSLCSQVPLAVRDYEENKVTRFLSATNSGSSTVYSTVQLPTVLSDPQSIYANSELFTNPGDS